MHQCHDCQVQVDTHITGAVAVGVNITVTETVGPGFVTAWDGSTGRPTASIVNSSGANQNIANYAIVPVLPDGTFQLFTSSTTHLIVDLMGYFPGTPTPIPVGITGQITGYGPGGSITEVSGTLTNGTTATTNARADVHCPDGATETDLVFSMPPGATRGFSVLCSGVFSSGATLVVVVV